MSNKINYYLKRYGFIGLMKFALYKKHLIKFNPYLFLQHHYYEKLREEDYEEELGEWYSVFNGRTVQNIQNPETFNDKIQWLKLHDDTEIRAICSDKFRVRDYIEALGIDKLKLIPIIGVWDSAEDINFERLPNAFVLKQNAACKLNMIVSDKAEIDYKKVREKMKTWLETTYGFNGMELQYLKSPKKIIAEEYLQELGEDLLDYKIFCFNGQPKYIEVIGDRGKDLKQGHSAFFDLEWKIMDFGTKTYPRFSTIPSRPECLEDMINISKKLSAPFSFVRVDLYEINNKIYFGEMTFTPTNGIARWYPEETDKRLGSLLHLDI